MSRLLPPNTSGVSAVRLRYTITRREREREKKNTTSISAHWEWPATSEVHINLSLLLNYTLIIHLNPIISSSEKGHFVLRERNDNCESAGNCKVAQCSFHPSRLELVCALDDGQVRLLKDEFNSNSSPTWTLDSSSLISSSRITCLAWNVIGSIL